MNKYPGFYAYARVLKNLNKNPRQCTRTDGLKKQEIDCLKQAQKIVEKHLPKNSIHITRVQKS